MKNLTHIILALSLATSAACNDDAPATPTPAEPGAWVLADCARTHDVTTHYRNTTGQVTLRVTRTLFFEDVPADAQSTLVRTCDAPPTTEWGCPTTSPGGQTCIGDEGGPWPLCTVAFAGTDGAGAGIVVCGERVTREVVDGSTGTVTQTAVTENATHVYLRPN